MNASIEQARYALNKQVPSMAGGCSINTAYGDIELTGEEAAILAAVVEKVLRNRIKQITQKAVKP